VEDAVAEDEALCAAVECADAVFREFAEMTAANDGKTFEEAYTVTWRLYEVGDLKLVGEGGRLRVRACITRTERRAAAKQNRPLAAYRRRLERWSKLKRERGSQLEQNDLIEIGPSGPSNDSRIAVGDVWR